jgi:hypothetical protein
MRSLLSLALVLSVISACKPQNVSPPTTFFVKWSMLSPQQSQFTPQGTGWTPSGTVRIMLMFEPIRSADKGDRAWTTKVRDIGTVTNDAIGSFGLDASPTVAYIVNRMCGAFSPRAVQPTFVAHDLSTGQKKAWTVTSADWYTHAPC